MQIDDADQKDKSAKPSWRRYSILVKESPWARVCELCQVDTNPEPIAKAARANRRYDDVCIIDRSLPHADWTPHQLNMALQGFVIHRSKAGFEAFDADQRSIGIFADDRAAVAAIMNRRPA
jgi:hypothetical protein